MNFGIEQGVDGVWRMTWERPTDISGLVWLSLNIEQGAFFNSPNFGFKLSDIKKITASNIQLIKTRAELALQWLLDTGKAKAIDVIVERDTQDYNRINWRAEIEQADGLTLTSSGFKTIG